MEREEAMVGVVRKTRKGPEKDERGYGRDCNLYSEPMAMVDSRGTDGWHRSRRLSNRVSLTWAADGWMGNRRLI